MSPTTFRRPTAEDAMTLAREQLIAGERVEMGALAEQLGINRTTLYRWVGDREQLIGTLLSALLDEWVELARAGRGEGIDGFLDLLRRVLETGAGFEPLSDFAQREPALALRILSDRHGPVIANADATIARELAGLAPDLDPSPATVHAIGAVARTLVWSNVATGHEPDIDGVMDVSRTLLEASPRRR